MVDLGNNAVWRYNQITNEAFLYLFQLVAAKDPVHELLLLINLLGNRSNV